MRIVLEGCDCTGKTQFANLLEKEIKKIYGVKEVRREHEGLPPNDVPSLFEYYAIKALAYDFCIHDRLHLGERTYGLVYRKNDRLGPVGQHIIDHIIRTDGFGVICDNPWPGIEKRWRKRCDLEYVKDASSLKTIYNAYKGYFDGGDAWMLLDPFIERNQLEVVNRIKIMSKISKPLSYECGIGPKRAHTLIVGEMSNHQLFDLPFFSVTGSSAYLISTLIDLDIGHNYYLTNAYRKDGTPREIRPIIKDLPLLKRVIALGREAVKVLKEQEIPHVNLPHPQFYHRFKHHDAANYLKLFQLAMEEDNASRLHLP